MEFIEVFKNFTPSFIGSIMGAILIAIILGQNPTNIGTLRLIFWVILLFILGVIFSWIILIRFKK